MVTPYDLHLHFELQPHGAPSLRCLTESNFSQTMQNKPLTSSGGAGSPPPPVLPAPKHNAALVCLGFLHSSSFHLSLDFPSGRQHTHSLQLASCPRRYLQIRGCQQADTLPQWLLYPPWALPSRKTPFPYSSPHQAFPTQLWAVHCLQPSQLLQPSCYRKTKMLSLMAVSSGRDPCEFCSTAHSS